MNSTHQNSLQENTARILVIDDKPESVAILAELLTDKGYEIRAALDENQAFKSLELDPVELILLDIRMPNMSGFKICEQLKSNKQTADIPIIFLTASGDTEDKIKGLELGAVDYITKPFNPDEVIARVQRQLKLKAEYQKSHRTRAYSKTALDKKTRQEICQLLVNYFEEEEPYLTGTLSLAEIAQKIGVTQHNLSEAVNTELQQTIPHFINNYRIEYFCQLYSQKPDASILELALQSGFKSKAVFNQWFKTIKKTTPREYIKSL